MIFIDINKETIKSAHDIIYEFACNSVYAGIKDIDSYSVYKTLEGIVNGNNYIGFMIKIDGVIVGVILGVCFNSPYFDELWNQEMVWYVKPDYRNKTGSILYKEYENRCRQYGVNRIMLSVMSNDNTDRLRSFLYKNNYKDDQVMFIKEIS